MKYSFFKKIILLCIIIAAKQSFSQNTGAFDFETTQISKDDYEIKFRLLSELNFKIISFDFYEDGHLIYSNQATINLVKNRYYLSFNDQKEEIQFPEFKILLKDIKLLKEKPKNKSVEIRLYDANFKGLDLYRKEVY